MEAKKKYFMDCHLAGRKYHDADEVWDQLKVGTVVRLVREADNRYDPNAIAVVYDDREQDEEFVLGYIPRDSNDQIAVLLDMGWTDIFECRISRIDPNAHYEQQITLTVKVKKNRK
ncbi:MAG: HIRAN domain-containing protein [Bacteroidales bacterium]|nr:HIRAN domain-containing protein [Bacteroidales bacterium]